MSKVLPQTDNQPQQTPPPQRRPRRWLRGVGLMLIIFAALLGWFLIIIYFGWQSGQSLLVERRESELTRQVTTQVDLARSDVAEGKYTLALRRLEWVLERDATNSEALTLQEEAQTALTPHLTPTPILAPTVTPSAPPLPTVTPGPIDSPTSELQRIRRLLDTQSWSTAVTALVTFQRQLPNYERLETDRMLYDAYINLGLDLVTGPEVELGLFYLAQAEKLGDLPQEVQDQRAWAELYLQGLAFYGVNWDVTAFYFRNLCLAAPFYQSSCDQLYEVLIMQGDQQAVAQEWCPAESLYREARQYGRSTTLTEKHEQAQQGCAEATPTPTTPLTTTVPLTNTVPFTDTQPVTPSASP